MDSVGRPPAATSLIFRAVTLLLLGCCSVFAGAAPVTSEPQDQIPKAQELAAGQRWQELLRLVEETREHSAELEYYRGLALAHLERWDEARTAFLAGRHILPRDKRFPIELAGVAFKQKKYPQAAAWLRRALHLDPTDSYANDFLATVYFLEGNLEAALKYWNRVGKPRIEEVRTEPTLHVNAVLLDHAFAFSPAGMLRSDDLLTSESRLRMLEIFSSYRLDLLARADEKFNVQIQAQERNGFGNTKLQAALALFRGLPYQEVNPEYFNIGGSATNVVSVLRWDAQKRRALTSLAGPFLHNPKWHYRVGTDLRDENWEIRKSFTGTAPALAGLNMRREGLSAEITRLIGGRWSWSTGVEFSHRDYRNVFAGAALTPQLLAPGNELSQSARLNYELLRMPERRLTIDSALSSQVGRLWSSPAESFTKLQASLSSRWLPRSQGDDYEARAGFRAGDTFGQIPFDELFMLGLERDNDLWLRGHIGTRDGRKGSAPLGSRYVLSNWETDKNLYRNGIVTLKLGPFLDSGRITGASSALGSSKWLWDTGVQSKISVLGIGVSVIYGKDLRTGNNAFYTTVGR
jgi:tetratricopeptide (TPR) repeat protein